MTEKDLMIRFAQDTGISLEEFSMSNENRFENNLYLHWLEHTLLELTNEKKQIEELFV